MNKENNIVEIVLTGGPCAGKTTALDYLRQNLTERGFGVFVVPEAATSFGIKNLSSIAKNDFQKFIEIEKQILLKQLSDREHFLALAKNFPEQENVIIYDRGPIEVKAFIGEEPFNEILKKQKVLINDIRDCYHGVVHLKTAADGATEFYTCANNQVRGESIEEAISLDKKTIDVWQGHSNFTIIDNSTNFEEKMQRVLQAVFDIINMSSTK